MDKYSYKLVNRFMFSMLTVRKTRLSQMRMINHCQTQLERYGYLSNAGILLDTELVGIRGLLLNA